MKATFTARWNTPVLEENYEKFLQNPDSVDASWRAFFEGFELGTAQPPSGKNGAAAPAAATTSAGAAAPDAAAVQAAVQLQGRVDGLVQAYRTLGHTLAQIDPLGQPRPEQPLLGLQELGFVESELDTPVSSRSFYGGKSMRLGEMIALLQKIYTGRIGAEFMHLSDVRARQWLRDRFEARVDAPALEPRARKPSSAICSRRKRSSAFCTRATSARSASRSKAARRSWSRWRPSSKRCPQHRRGRRSSWAWPTAAGSTCWPTSCKKPLQDHLHRVQRELRAQHRSPATAT